MTSESGYTEPETPDAVDDAEGDPIKRTLYAPGTPVPDSSFYAMATAAGTQANVRIYLKTGTGLLFPSQLHPTSYTHFVKTST